MEIKKQPNYARFHYVGSYDINVACLSEKAIFFKNAENTQFIATRPTPCFLAEIISGEVECNLVKACFSSTSDAFPHAASDRHHEI